MKYLCKFLKAIIFLIAILIVLPLSLLSTIEKFTSKKTVFFHFGAHCVALVPGLLGNMIRAAFYYLTLDKYNPNSTISFGSYFSHREAVVDSNVYIGCYSILGRVHLHDNVLVASKVSILSGLHEHGNSEKRSDLDQEMKEVDGEKLSIGQNSWLGEGSLVGVSVGSDATVAIGAVVIKEVPKNCMAMGNPARNIPSGWAKKR